MPESLTAIATPAPRSIDQFSAIPSAPTTTNTAPPNSAAVAYISLRSIIIIGIPLRIDFQGQLFFFFLRMKRGKAKT